MPNLEENLQTTVMISELIIPPPQGSTLSPLKRCKGIQSDYFIEFTGIFSQVYLELTLYVCVHASIKMLEQNQEEGCLSLIILELGL